METWLFFIYTSLMKNIEILAPVGSMEVLEAAIQGGCDAIYCALPSFGARAYANNFTWEQMKEVLKRCHSLNIKVHVTMNTLLFEQEIEQAYQQAKRLHEMGVDALIVQDLGLIHLLHERLPQLVVHASTQLSVTQVEQIEQLKKLGVKRVVLARECSLEQVKAAVQTGMEVEVFVHGAICICYSGQCLFSSIEYDRSGNRGMCAQPCRMPYKLYQDGKPILEKEQYFLSPKDLSLIEQVRELEELGVCSIKIEGRMKSKEYVYECVHQVYEVLHGKTLGKKEQKELQVTFNRGFTKGHLYDQRGNALMNTQTSNHQGILIGHVIGQKGKRVRVKLQDSLHQNDGIRFVWKTGSLGFRLNYLYDTQGKLIAQAKAGQIVEINMKDRLPAQTKLIKTIDTTLQKEIDQTIVKKQRKVAVSCHLVCKGPGYPLECTLSENGHCVTWISEELADVAKNRPCDEEVLKRQFSKTKDSFIEIQSFRFALDAPFFFPLGALNHIRNQAIDAFYEEKTKANPIIEKTYDVKIEPQKIVERHWIQEKIHSSMEGLADLRYNVTNSYAIACLLRLGFSCIELSLECKDKDIQAMLTGFKERYGFEAPVMVYLYGKRRLMIMNHCVVNTALKDGQRKNCALCHRHSFYLKGKDQKEYLLEGDAKCHMCIFEKEAWNDLDKIAYYKQLGIQNFHLFFLREDALKKAKILKEFQAGVQE